ncbi:MAG: type II toxin-antitoxin system VapC family toxin [Pseudomonadota bacterium]
MDDRHYMLDTNTASYIIRGEPASLRHRLLTIPMNRVCISAITEAELLRGVARRPGAANLKALVGEFLSRVEILPWNSVAARNWAELKTRCEKEGTALGAMDMLIAAHSLAAEATLVTSDRSFHSLSHLTLEDWTRH